MGRNTMTRILAIDPGPVRSAWLLLADGRPERFGIHGNEQLLRALRRGTSAAVVVIEEIESFGMAVGREVFETVHWSGRFTEALDQRGTPVRQLPRRRIKTHLCGSAKAKDANVRQALLDRFGGSAAIGRKAAPGPLYGIARDAWSALAIAVTYADGAA